MATEQIDRVYESLDPEYEYERERHKQQQTTQWPLQHGLRHDELGSQPTNNNTNSPSLFPQTKKEPRKDDISDLLQSTQLTSQASPPLARPTSDANKNGINSGLSQGKLAYNEDIADASADGWGDDDAWGDDWDDQAAIDKVEPTTDPSSTIKQPTLPTQSTMQQPLGTPQDKPDFGFQTQQADRQQDGFRPQSRDGNFSGESTRNMMDLLGAPRSSSLSVDQGSRAANNLLLPQPADSVYTESPHRRPSADVWLELL